MSQKIFIAWERCQKQWRSSGGPKGVGDDCASRIFGCAVVGLRLKNDYGCNLGGGPPSGQLLSEEMASNWFCVFFEVHVNQKH